MKPAAVALAGTLALASAARAEDARTPEVELASAGAFYGLALGIWSSVELDLSPRPAAWVSAATTAGGLFGGLKLVDSLDLSLAQVRLTESVGFWSALDWLLLVGELDAFGEETIWLTFGVTAVAAGGALLAAHQGFDPSPGHVSLVNSGGLWAMPAGLLFGFTFHLGSGEHLPRDLLVLNLLGLGAGVGLAHLYDPSREQVLYLDAGLLAGGLGGGLLGVMVGVGTDTEEVATGMTLLGMAGGAWIAVAAAGFGDGEADRAATPKRRSARKPAVTLPLWAGTW
ncbi:MAG: hypothetical protein R3F60_24715 [bacterium]